MFFDILPAVVLRILFSVLADPWLFSLLVFLSVSLYRLPLTPHAMEVSVESMGQLSLSIDFTVFFPSLPLVRHFFPPLLSLALSDMSINGPFAFRFFIGLFVVLCSLLMVHDWLQGRSLTVVFPTLSSFIDRSIWLLVHEGVATCCMVLVFVNYCTNSSVQSLSLMYSPLSAISI